MEPGFSVCYMFELAKNTLAVHYGFLRLIKFSPSVELLMEKFGHFSLYNPIKKKYVRQQMRECVLNYLGGQYNLHPYAPFFILITVILHINFVHENI